VAWDDLRVFLAVAQAGSLRRASARRGPRCSSRPSAPDYWLLVHPDLRAVPRVRRVIDWIRAVFKETRGGRRTT
jgi:DNA-binding transcriptional LysR family regulator